MHFRGFLEEGCARRLGLWLFFLFQAAPPLPVFGDRAQWIPLLGVARAVGHLLANHTYPAGWGLAAGLRHLFVALLLSFHFLFQSGLYWAESSTPARISQARRSLVTLFLRMQLSRADWGRRSRSWRRCAGFSQYSYISSLTWTTWRNRRRYGSMFWMMMKMLIDERVWERAKPIGAFPVGYSQKYAV